MEGLAHAHNQLPSALSKLPIICAGHVATTPSSKVKIKSPRDWSKLQRVALPNPQPVWWATVLRRNSSMLASRSFLNSGVSPWLPSNTPAFSIMVFDPTFVKYSFSDLQPWMPLPTGQNLHNIVLIGGSRLLSLCYPTVCEMEFSISKAQLPKLREHGSAIEVHQRGLAKVSFSL